MTEAMSTRVKVTTIASAAGVSAATVSKVLHDRPDVSAATRARVKAVLAEHRYVRRGVARGQRPGGSGLIELVFSALDTPWATEIITGAESVARSMGAGVVVSAIDGADERRTWVKAAITRRCRGVIVVLWSLPLADRRRLTQHGIPVVAVDPVGKVDTAVASVGASNWAGGLSATQHLIDLGHRRIATVTGPMEFLCSRDRLEGYRTALTRAGIPADARLEREGNFHFPTAVRATEELLGLAEPPTAIFAASDEEALGVYEGVRRRGLRVPDDVSVVGFDDVAVSAWTWPPMTTVRQPLREMAAIAARMLLVTGDSGAQDDRRIEVSTSLVVRDSTSPPRR